MVGPGRARTRHQSRRARPDRDYWRARRLRRSRWNRRGNNGSSPSTCRTHGPCRRRSWDRNSSSRAVPDRSAHRLQVTSYTDYRVRPICHDSIESGTRICRKAAIRGQRNLREKCALLRAPTRLCECRSAKAESARSTTTRSSHRRSAAIPSIAFCSKPGAAFANTTRPPSRS